MNITLNGEKRSVDPDSSIERLVQSLGLQDKRIAVEVNRDIVPRSEYGTYILNDDDSVEIVNAIGGG